MKSQRFLELNFVGRPAHPDDCRATGLEAHDEESPQSTTTELRLLQQGFTALMVSKGLLYWSRHEMNPNHHSKGLKKWSVLMDLAMLNQYCFWGISGDIAYTWYEWCLDLSEEWMFDDFWYTSLLSAYTYLTYLHWRCQWWWGRMCYSFHDNHVHKYISIIH